MSVGDLSLLPSPQRIRPGRGYVQRKAGWALRIPNDADHATRRVAASLAKELGVRLIAVAGPGPGAFSVVWGPAGTKRTVRPERLVRRPEGYSLQIARGGVTVCGADEAGLFYGSRTLLQLVRRQGRLPLLRIDDWPATRLRAVHLDLKGLMPTLPNLRRLIDRLADLKVNAVVAEWEDKIAFDAHPAIASRLALSKRQVRSLVRYAADRYVRVIPLQQTLGHLEYVLKHSRYARLREAGLVNEIDPLDPRAVALITDLLDEMVALHPDRDFHIGADEAWGLGSGKRGRRFIARHGKDELLLRHIETISGHVRNHDRRPLIWDDMFRRQSRSDLRRVRELGALVCWLYGYDDPRRVAEQAPMLARYRDAGIQVIGASAIKGAGRSSHTNATDYVRRCGNVDFWAEAARKYDLEGVIATAWSRYASLMPMCDPWEGAWLSCCYAAERAWAGPGSSREQFDRSFSRLELGLDEDPQAVVARMTAVCSDPAPDVIEDLSTFARQTKDAWGRRVLSYHAAAAELNAWLRQASWAAELVGARWPYLSAGPTHHEPHSARRFEGIIEASAGLSKRLTALLTRTYGPEQAQEFVESRFAGPLQLLRWADARTLGGRRGAVTARRRS